MREVTATEASRRFAAVLDEAERGETIVITRGGVRIALLVPAPSANGAALREVLERWRPSLDLDDRFAEDVAAARALVTAERDTDPWAG